MAQDDIISLRSGESSAQIARLGAEPVSWTAGGRELLWHRDPAHWARSAPILFPVIGASAGGVIKVAGQTYAMPQHGFARDSGFEIVEIRADAVLLRLTESEESRKCYPFSFSLSVRYVLDNCALSVAFTVDNRGNGPMPYQLGFHPAFPWPFECRAPGDQVIFAVDAERDVRRPDANGLLRHKSDQTLTGAHWPVSGDLFANGAYVFADAQSDATTFAWADGGKLSITTEGFPHVAVWTKPTAPFISVEQWTGLPDWEGFDGALSERASVSLVPSGQSAHHAIVLRYTPD